MLQATAKRAKPVALVLRVGHEWAALKDVLHFASFFDELDPARTGHITLVGIVEYMEAMDAAISREVRTAAHSLIKRRGSGLGATPPTITLLQVTQWLCWLTPHSTESKYH